LRKYRNRRRRERQAEQHHKRNRVLLISFGVATVLLATLVAAFMLLPEGITFEEAQNDPNLRSKYTKQVVSTISNKPRQLVEVRYIGTLDELLPERLDPSALELQMMTRSDFFPAQFGKAEFPARIIVFPGSFSISGSNQTELDFISTLKHEFRHIRQYNEELTEVSIKRLQTLDGEWNDSLIHNVLEIDANRMELHSNLPISQSRIEARELQYIFNYLNIWLNSKKMDSLVIENLKVDFFECWMLTHDLFLQRSLQDTWTWYVKSTKPTDPGMPFSLTIEEIEKIKAKNLCE
jgi:hypothetical protein